jgi:hypothetical protein
VLGEEFLVRVLVDGPSVSGVCSTFEHMSEDGVGAVERELLTRARDAEVTRRRDHFARLELVAELEPHGVAQATGDRGTARLLQSHWRLDHAGAQRLVDEAADLTERRSLSGEPLPPRLPCTATVAAAGEIAPEHIAVIRRTLTRLERIDTLAVEDWVQAERFLAAKATVLSPAGSAQLATALIAHLDPESIVARKTSASAGSCSRPRKSRGGARGCGPPPTPPPPAPTTRPTTPPTPTPRTR